jgi:uncharacterized protein with PIN domain
MGMLREKCEGVLIRKNGDLVDCPKKPTKLTEELLSYCDSCYSDYEKGRKYNDGQRIDQNS